MAPPTALDMATRIPGGIPLQDGYQTLIGLTLAPTIRFWEKTVTPPGVDGGDSIDRTTMHNIDWKTKGARSLKDMTDITCTANYDPAVHTDIEAAINREDTITIVFADGTTIAMFGYLQKFESNDVQEGETPECTITFVITNWDPTNNVEAGPTVNEIAGT